VDEYSETWLFAIVRKSANPERGVGLWAQWLPGRCEIGKAR
jgi:hypothetical protein